MGWRNRPTYIHKWPDGVNVTMFLDESGDSYLKSIKKKILRKETINENDKFFTITGCVIKKEDFTSARDGIINLKKKYWEDGKFNYDGKRVKRVCFHSYEIRGRKGAFSEKVVDYSNFITDLSIYMENLPTVIFTSTINKEKFCLKYPEPTHPYSLCLDFILERFVKFYLKHSETGIIILEARGKAEDRFILDHIKNLIDNGTKYVDASHFKKIKGVYFNPKWCMKSLEQKSYFGLECSDLYSYPVYKYSKLNKKDKAFLSIENKIYGYPNYDGRGYKIFPKA